MAGALAARSIWSLLRIDASDYGETTRWLPITGGLRWRRLPDAEQTTSLERFRLIQVVWFTTPGDSFAHATFAVPKLAESENRTHQGREALTVGIHAAWLVRGRYVRKP